MAIATPEGVTLEVTLAGAGSRGVAATVDGLIQTGIILALGFIMAILLGDEGPSGSSTSALLIVALINVFFFLVIFLYHVFFETFWSGRTPGKKATGLRVVDLSGRPTGFKVSAVRNLLRIVDFLPTTYIVGIIAILASSKNQRIGDMVAGTLVVREQTQKVVPPIPPSVQHHTPSVVDWDVSAITREEFNAVRSFLGRRTSLTLDARDRLADQFAANLRSRVVGGETEADNERFLEKLVAAKAARE